MKLFGSSGIRGLANLEITISLAQKVGTAIASMFDGGAVLVGRDTRLSGEMIELALSSGLVSSGFVVGTLGVAPTPIVAWLTREIQAEAGVAISASHNPPQYNLPKNLHSHPYLIHNFAHQLWLISHPQTNLP